MARRVRSSLQSLESEELNERARAFAIGVSRLVDKVSQTIGAQVVGRQSAKSATSVSANYIAACSARSRAEFIAKLCIVNEEGDESVNWLEIMIRVLYLPAPEVEPHRQEAIELRAIFGRSLGTARRNAHTNDPMTK